NGPRHMEAGQVRAPYVVAEAANLRSVFRSQEGRPNAWEEIHDRPGSRPGGSNSGEGRLVRCADSHFRRQASWRAGLLHAHVVRQDEIADARRDLGAEA